MSAVRACRFADLVAGSALRVELDGEAVCIVRVGDAVHAIGDRCSHANISLSEGEVIADRLEIECWKHGSAFSLVTGEPSTLPATQPVPVYAARVVDGDVIVTIGSDGAGVEPAGTALAGAEPDRGERR